MGLISMNQLSITLSTPSTQQQIPISNGWADLRLSEILRRSSFALNTRCGGRGLCDGCLVHLQAGTVRHRATGQTISATDPDPKAHGQPSVGFDI